jgi:hypothetical protein
MLTSTMIVKSLFKIEAFLCKLLIDVRDNIDTYLPKGSFNTPVLHITALSKEPATNQVYKFIRDIIVSGDEWQMKDIALMGGNWQVRAKM